MGDVGISGAGGMYRRPASDRRCDGVTILNFRDQVKRFQQSGNGCRWYSIPCIAGNDNDSIFAGNVRPSDERDFHVGRLPEA